MNNRELIKRKKERIKIRSLEDFKLELEKNNIKDKENKLNLKNNLDLIKEKELIKNINLRLKNEDITYVSKDINKFLEFMDKLFLFEELNERLEIYLKKVKILMIERIEYESDDRERVKIYDKEVEPVLDFIKEVKEKITFNLNYDEEDLEIMEKEVGKEIVFSKDIEIIKNMILTEEAKVKEYYNEETKIRKLIIELPENLNKDYIKVKKGSIEYHEHINSSIPRLERLINNLDNFLELRDEEEKFFKINQSKLIQDTINIAFARFNGITFKAISGSNNIDNYCNTVNEKESRFKSYNVNKLGRLGIGYNRINDSEKKILEEISRLIGLGEMKNEGRLDLYTKWEPCPSCYSVVGEFLKLYPNIKININFKSIY